MDAALKVLAGASLELAAAEEALAEGASLTARERLDGAAAALGVLRARWPKLAEGERKVIATAAQPVRERLDAVEARMPKVTALSEGPEHDPEEQAAA